MNETVDLTYNQKEKLLFCERCRANKCGHIYAAAKIPEVQQKIERREIFIEEL